jgi:hypothetical protein
MTVSIETLSYEDILKLSVDELGNIGIKCRRLDKIPGGKYNKILLNKFISNKNIMELNINDFEIFYDPNGDKHYFAAVTYFKLLNVNMLCYDLKTDQISELSKCKSIDDITKLIEKYGDNFTKYFTYETLHNLLNHYTRTHTFICNEDMLFNDINLLNSYCSEKYNSDNSEKNKRVYLVASYLNINVEDLTNNDIINYVNTIDNIITNIFVKADRFNPFLNLVHSYLDMLSSVYPNNKLNIVMYRGYAENSSTTKNRNKYESSGKLFNFNRKFSPQFTHEKRIFINIPTILKSSTLVKTDISNDLSLYPNSEGVLIETTVYPGIPFVLSSNNSNRVLVLASGLPLISTAKNCIKEENLPVLPNKTLNVYCAEVGKPIIERKSSAAKKIQKIVDNYNKDVKDVSIFKANDFPPLKSKSPVKTKTLVKSKTKVHHAPTNWADEKWEEDPLGVISQKGGKKFSLALLNKKLKNGKITKEKYNNQVRNVLKKYNSNYTKKLIKLNNSDKKNKNTEKKIARLEKKLKLNIDLFDQLNNGTFNYNKVDKVIEKFNEENKSTTQVGGGKTRMDSVKNTLKIYKRRYNNSKTEDARDKLNKLYNKILRNKTKLNIRYYKNKLNDLNKLN